MTPGILTRRLCSTTLLAQAVIVFFGAQTAWGLAQAAGEGGGNADLRLWGGVVIALVCVLAAGLMRRGRAGIVLGWLAQLLTLASAVVLSAMLIVALIFGGLWWVCLTQGRRMDRITAERDAEAARAGAAATDPTTED